MLTFDWMSYKMLELSPSGLSTCEIMVYEK